MVLEKVKKSISNFSDFYASLFIPASKQYFEKEMTKAYSNISLDKKRATLTLEEKIKFNSLKEELPFILNLIELRKEVKSNKEYVSLSFVIFNEYYKRLKNKNILYVVNSSNQRDTRFSENVSDYFRTQFYINIRQIFLYIEKNHLTYLNTHKDNSIRNFKTGPNNNELKKIALKYFLIQHFYKEERLETTKYKNQKDFLEKIGKIEGIVPGSLKTHYAPIKYSNLNDVFKSNKVFFEEMLIDNVFENHYDKCIKYLEENIKN